MRSLRAVLVRDVYGAGRLVPAILLATGDRLGGLAADEVDHVVRNQRAVAWARYRVGAVDLVRGLPGRAPEELRAGGGEDGKIVGRDALEGPVDRGTLASSSRGRRFEVKGRGSPARWRWLGGTWAHGALRTGGGHGKRLDGLDAVKMVSVCTFIPEVLWELRMTNRMTLVTVPLYL